MIIKLMWYCSSLLSVIFILFSNPKSNTLSSFGSQSKILSLGSGQMFMQRFISFLVLMFFIFTCLSLLFI